MKTALLSIFILPIAYAAPEIVPSPIDHLYIPDGFDSNDSVEIVVTGNFPTPCYSRNNVSANVNDDMIDINVTALNPKLSSERSESCPSMLVPFKEVVGIGNLQSGKYKVRVNQNSDYFLQDNLTISEASSSAVDDNIYAAAEWIEKKSATSFNLHGWKYSPCYQLDKISVISNNKDTLSILPIMKKNSDFCPRKGVPVTYELELDFSSIKSSNPLLHVRTMDGKSINTIVNFEK